MTVPNFEAAPVVIFCPLTWVRLTAGAVLHFKMPIDHAPAYRNSIANVRVRTRNQNRQPQMGDWDARKRDSGPMGT